MKHNFTPDNKKPALYLALLVAVVALMFMLKQCSMKSPYAGVEPHHSGGDTLDVAIEYSPLLLYRHADTLGGFNYDMMRMVAKQEGLVLKFHPLTALPEALDGLNGGLYDIVVADLAGSSDFQERYIVTEPVYLDRQVLVQRKDSLAVVSTLDLGGKDVWVSSNASVVSRLQNLSAEIGDSIFVHQDSLYGSEQLVMLVATGDIDMAVVNESVANAMLKDYPELDVSTKVSFSQFQPWLLGKNNQELASRLDSAIIGFKATSCYEELFSRYFKR